MVDSESVVISGEVTTGRALEPVMPATGCEREEALGDAGDEALQGAGAVSLERELVLAGVEDRLDPLPNPSERAEAGFLVTAVGTQHARSVRVDDLLELLAGEALVDDERLTGLERPLEEPERALALGRVGGGQLKGDRRPVGGTQQVEAKAPEEARMRGAVAVAGMACQLRALDRLARLRAGNRGRVEQPQAVAEGRREPGERRHEL